MESSIRAVYELAAFSRSERKTLRLIGYVAARGCFGYGELMTAWKQHKEVRIKWHTVERTVRKLAEMELLERRWTGKRSVEFCLSPRLEYILRQLGWLQ